MHSSYPEPRRTLYVYGDESGDFKTQPYFLLGLVLTYHPHRHDQAIQQLRERFGYSRQFEYKKTDRLKVGLAAAVLEYFLECDDLEFRTVVIPTRDYGLHRHLELAGTPSQSPAAIAYNDHYRRLVQDSTSTRDDIVLLLDGRTDKRDDELARHLQARIPNIKNIKLVDSAKHNLVQLADLLTGSVFGDLTNTTHPVKRGLIEVLKQRLEVARLTDRPGRFTHKFRRYGWRPPEEA